MDEFLLRVIQGNKGQHKSWERVLRILMHLKPQQLQWKTLYAKLIQYNTLSSTRELVRIVCAVVCV